MKTSRKKIFLVCSAGGHFLELYMLKDFWKDYDRLWITHPGQDTEYLLRDERVILGYSPTMRNFKNLMMNTLLAVRLIRSERPDAIITTGAAIGVPFVIMGKLMKIPTIYIEYNGRNWHINIKKRCLWEGYMIFVMVGSEKFCFKRLLVALDEGIEQKKIREKVFAQIGNSRYNPVYYEFDKFISFKKIIKNIMNSRFVVTHAGVGSILLCLNFNKIPIVFPRVSSYGEHVDNHQLEFAKKLEQEKLVLVSYDTRMLIHTIQNYDKLVKRIQNISSTMNSSDLISFLKRSIDEKD